MAKQRVINTKFWSDSYITNLDPVEKLLFLYCLTNPYTNITGIYEVPLRNIAFDTGIEKEMVEKILKRFEEDKKIIYKDGWIIVINFIKHQIKNMKVIEGILNELNKIPEKICTLAIDYGYSIHSLSYLNLNLNLNSNLNLNLNSNLYNTCVKNKKIVFDCSNYKLKNINIELLKEKFPAVNVEREIKKMEAWLMANPKNRKSNYERFITNWLSRTQDRAKIPFESEEEKKKRLLEMLNKHKKQGGST